MSMMDSNRLVPAADAAPMVQGLWLWTERGTEDWEKYYVCSNCREYAYWQTNFCPNCGAQMNRCNGREMTNGVRIRAMTDEELAERYPICANTVFDANMPCGEYEDCRQCFLDWLRQEAENA